MIPRSLRECECLKTSPNGAAPSRVDAASKGVRIIRGVKIISSQSSNRRHYTESCLRAAVALYEGASVRANHQSDESSSDRDVADVMGDIRNVRYTGDGLRGDLYLLPSHKMTPLIVEAAKVMPRAYGLSHNVSDWDGHYEGGTYVVTAIREVESVDLVADPATTKGLFESRNKRRRKPMNLTEWIKKQQPKVRASVRRLIEDGSMDGSMLLGGDSPESSVKAAFKSAIMAVIDDDGLDLVSAMGKVKAILKAREDLIASGAITPAADVDAPTEAPALEDEPMEDDVMPEEPLDDEDDDSLEEMDSELEDDDEDEDEDDLKLESRRKPKTPTQAEEVASLREENRKLKAEQHVRSLCETHKVSKPSNALLKALMALDDDAERRQLLREQRRPTSAKEVETPLVEALTREDDEDGEDA